MYHDRIREVLTTALGRDAERVIHGRIARVSPVLDPATRTASMEVEIPNADNKLKPGMYARVALTVEEHKDVDRRF